jgi:hypothetical protein
VAVSLFVGTAVHWRIGGAPTDLPALAISIASSAGTAFLLFGSKFLWHLFLAPSEIIHNEVRPVLEGAGIMGVPRPPNFSIWRHRKSYNTAEFASLLVSLDPGSSQTVDYRAMQWLVLEGLRNGELKYAMPAGSGPAQPGYVPDISVFIAKEDALIWAEARGLAAKVAPLRSESRG